MKDVIKLSNGQQIPALGYGVWMIEDLAVCEQCVLDALDAGYRLIDTAAVYLNERAVGAALKKSPVAREELFVTTKLWVQDMGYEQTRRAFQRSMERLQLDYCDMYMIHWPFGDYAGSWKAMEELHAEGKIKNLGVCNFSEYHLRNLLLAAEVKPVINQVECHPYFQQKELRAYLKKADVALQSYSPLGHGKSELLDDPVLAGLAGKYEKTIAQIILRWHVQEGFSTIPKSANPDRIRSNFAIDGFTLSADDMAAIASLDTYQRVGLNPNDPKFEGKMHRFTVDI